MGWLSFAKVLLQAVAGIASYLEQNQLIDTAKAAALKEATDETLELARHADRVDRSTDRLSDDAARRMRKHLRRN